MGLKAFAKSLIKNKIPSGFSSRRLIVIASILLFAIAVLGIIQWAIGTRGWNLAAGILTIIMVAVSLGLVGVLIMMLPSRILMEAKQLRVNKSLFGKDDDWPHYNDPSYLSSPLNRNPFDD